MKTNPVKLLQYFTLSCLLYIRNGNYAESNLKLESNHHHFMRASDDYRIQCTSLNGENFSFYRAVDDSMKVIEPKANEVVIMTCREEPSGSISKTMIKKNMTLDDRAMYYCMNDDHKSSVSTSISVLKATKREIIYYNENRSMSLQCDIEGFNETPQKTISVAWFRNGSLIGRIIPPSNLIFKNGSYLHSYDGTTMTLNITRLGYDSAGEFRCMFGIQTTSGSLYVSDEYNITETPYDVFHPIDSSHPSVEQIFLYSFLSLFCGFIIILTGVGLFYKFWYLKYRSSPQKNTPENNPLKVLDSSPSSTNV